jgi:hypothetical protein
MPPRLVQLSKITKDAVGFTRSWFYQRTHRGELPELFIRVDRTVFLDLDRWSEFLERNRIPADTLKKRAERIRSELGTNVPNEPTDQDHSEIQKKPEILRNEKGNQFVKGTAPGPGRKPKAGVDGGECA